MGIAHADAFCGDLDSEIAVDHRVRAWKFRTVSSGSENLVDSPFSVCL
jgi:hypothetical protein